MKMFRSRRKGEGDMEQIVNSLRLDNSPQEVVEKANGHKEPNDYEVPEPPKGMTANLELMTPLTAKELLAGDFTNRKLRTRHVALLVEDMKANRFYATNQAIGIDETGTLIDGQHRLQAIVESGKPQWIWVIRGVKREAALALDRNSIRSPGDNLQMDGYSYGTELASAARVVGAAEESWERDLKINSVKSKQFTQSTLITDILKKEMLSAIAGGDRESLSEADLQEAGRDLMEAARKLYERNLGGPGIPKAAGAAFYYLARTRYGIEETEEFINQAGAGLGLEDGSPARALRIKVAGIREDAKGRTGIASIEYLAYLIVAFNKFVKGEVDVRQLKLPYNGTLPKIATRR